MIVDRIKRIFGYHLKERLPQATLGALKTNAARAYWYRETVNFGDLLTPIILRHHGFTPVHAYPRHAQLVATGSILEHLPEDFHGVILGSGFIHESSSSRFPNAQILAVRGAYTRDRIKGLSADIPLGDPGLYATRLMGERREPARLLGIIPHHSNLASPSFRRIKERAPNDVAIISPVAQPKDVFDNIRRCEMLISSSLHGLIIADALGIPSVWSAESSLVGGNFKFFDYASAVGRTAWHPIELHGEETFVELAALASCAPSDKIKECQEGLGKAFEVFFEGMRSRR